jgi:biotin synthase
MQSPTYIKTSLASAMALRFVSGRFYRDAKPYCINLLLSYSEDCKANCAYCGLAQTRPTGEDSFIRVDWPILETGEVVRRIVRYRENIRRVCISTVFHANAVEDTYSVAREIVGATRRVAPTEMADLPLSVLITPGIFGQTEIERLKELGVDTVGIGLDAASERVFKQTRGEGIRGPLSWEIYLTTLGEASKVFGPGKVSCHIIVGLGETDKELGELFFHVKALGAMIHLFSFYPEPHSNMARHKRPSLKRFRRAQLLCYLVERDMVSPGSLSFDGEGRLIGICNEDILRDRPLSLSIREAIESGRPFLTGGCPSVQGDIACNRPFGSYRPGEAFRDFPFHPTKQDVGRLVKELRLEEILGPEYIIK